MPKYGTFEYGRAEYGSDDPSTQAGVTHQIVLDGNGFMLASPLQKSDITSAIPRVSIGTDQRKHTDFSERDTFGQHSFHHGRGASEIEDPATFLDAYGLVTWLPFQVTLMPRMYTQSLTGGATPDFDGVIVAMEVYSGNLYGALNATDPANNKVLIYDNTNNEWDTVGSVTGLTTTGSLTDLFTSGNSSVTVMVLCQGESANATFFDGATWTAMDVPIKFAFSYDAKFWRTDNLNELYWTPTISATPTWNASGAAIEVGDKAYPIRGVLSGFDGAVWIGKDDGLYSLRPGDTADTYVVTKVIDFTDNRSQYNGAAMTMFGGNLYVSVHTTILRYDGTTVQYMGPDRGANETEKFFQTNTQIGQPIVPQPSNLLPPTYQAGVVGRIVGLTHDGTYLYAAVDNDGLGASKVMLWAGTGWHTIRQTAAATDRIRSLFSFPDLATTGYLDFPTLWWCETVSGVEHLKVMKGSRYSKNPLDDASLEYESIGVLTTGWFDAGLPDISKTFMDFITEARGLVVGDEDIDVEFQVDDHPVWYSVGTANTIPTHVLYLPDNGSLEPAISAKKIRYRITLNRGSTATNTPILHSWGTRFIVRPDSRYGWVAVVKVYEEHTEVSRHSRTQFAATDRALLYAMRDKLIPINLRDGLEPPALTNLVTNPALLRDSNGDGTCDGVTAVGTGVTLTQTAQYKAVGLLSQKVVLASGSGDKGISFGTFAATAGNNIYVSAHVYVQSGDNITLELLDPSSVVVDSFTFREAGSDSGTARFKREGFMAEAETTGNYTLRIIRRTADGSAATTYYVDGVEFITDTPTRLARDNSDYIDGDQLRCRWTGTPHASSSTRQAGYYVYLTGLSEVYRYPEFMTSFIDYSTQITVQMREMQ